MTHRPLQRSVVVPNIGAHSPANSKELVIWDRSSPEGLGNVGCVMTKFT